MGKFGVSNAKNNLIYFIIFVFYATTLNAQATCIDVSVRESAGRIEIQFVFNPIKEFYEFDGFWFYEDSTSLVYMMRDKSEMQFLYANALLYSEIQPQINPQEVLYYKLMADFYGSFLNVNPNNLIGFVICKNIKKQVKKHFVLANNKLNNVYLKLPNLLVMTAKVKGVFAFLPVGISDWSLTEWCVPQKNTKGVVLLQGDVSTKEQSFYEKNPTYKKIDKSYKLFSCWLF